MYIYIYICEGCILHQWGVFLRPTNLVNFHIKKRKNFTNDAFKFYTRCAFCEIHMDDQIKMSARYTRMIKSRCNRNNACISSSHACRHRLCWIEISRSAKTSQTTLPSSKQEVVSARCIKMIKTRCHRKNMCVSSSHACRQRLWWIVIPISAKTPQTIASEP